MPAFCGRVPEVALRSLRMMKGNGIPTVLLAVYGNRAPEDTLPQLRDEAWASGFRCIAGIEAVARHSLFPQYGEGRPDDKDAQELRGFAQRIAEKLEAGDWHEPAHLPSKCATPPVSNGSLCPIVTGRCDGCGLCARECPVQAIPRDAVKRLDRKKCINCMHCVTVCPQQARKLPTLLKWAAARMLREACTERKPNVLYL